MDYLIEFYKGLSVTLSFYVLGASLFVPWYLLFLPVILSQKISQWSFSLLIIYGAYFFVSGILFSLISDQEVYVYGVASICSFFIMLAHYLFLKK